MALVESTTGEVVARSLDECEAVIERGLETFTQVGEALMEIRENRLYRPEFSDFDSYCRERWDMTRRRAGQLITAAEVVAELGTIVPSSESHARALSPLKDEPERMREAFQKASAEAEAAGSKLTADRIKAAVNELTGEELAEEPDPPGRPASAPDTSSAAPLAPTESGDRETPAGPLTGSTSVGAPTSPEAERDAAVTAAAREISRTHALFRWDPAELVALNDPDIDAGIRNLMAVISPWWESYKAAKPKGLVVHQGGKQ